MSDNLDVQENIKSDSEMETKTNSQEGEMADTGENPAAASSTISSATDNEGSGQDDQDDELDLKIPQEHARLNQLLSKIPKKAQHGLLMQCDLILTCIDANEYFIALGTNIGLAFLYNRKDQSIQRLKTEMSSDVITCIGLHHGVDHQLAIGTSSGTLCIFLVPSYMSLHKKQLQKFDVRSVHRHYITCVEWSTNGMKLYSGDKTGHVVMTEVDFYQGECKSSLLLVEPPTEVVQLCYNHKVLLVSTKARSFVCRLDTTAETRQVGQQDRKVLGNFGACFIPAQCKTDDAQLYAARPGCRVWLADVAGSVINTHKFKDSVGAGGVPDMPVLHPSRNTFNPTAELQFGRLRMFRGKQLITYNTTTLFLLDPARNRVVASQSRLGGIVDVAVHAAEVFVLRRHTQDAVVRLAEEPEAVYDRALPFDLPLSMTMTAHPATTAPSLVTQETSAAAAAAPKQEDNKTKTFFKNKFFSPFKKLDNFIHEQISHTKDSQDGPSLDSLEPVIGPPKDRLQPVIKASAESENEITPRASPVSSRRGSEDSSSDLPPIVALDSPDLGVRLYSGGVGAAADILSPDSAHSALSVFADEVVSPTSDTVQEVSEVAVSASGGGTDGAASGGQANDVGDIIFSHQMIKKKGKKKKHKDELWTDEKPKPRNAYVTGKGALGDEPDQAGRHGDDDIGPQHSLRETTGNDEEVDEVLQRAEEALSSASRFLTEGAAVATAQEPASAHVVSAVAKSRDSAAAADSSSKNVVGVQTSAGGKSGGEKLGEEVEGVVVMDAKVKEKTSKFKEGESEKPAAAGDSSLLAPTTQALDSHKRSLAIAPTPPPGGASTTKSSSPSKPAIHFIHPETAREKADSVKVAKEGAASLETAKQGADSLEAVRDRKDSLETAKQGADSLEAVRDGKGSLGAVVKEGADPLEAAEKSLDKMSRYSKLRLSKEDSADDFYSKFSAPYSPDSMDSFSLGPHQGRSFDDAESDTQGLDRPDSLPPPPCQRSVPEVTMHRLANSWSEFTTPANIYSLALSKAHVWFTDKSENLYYSALSGTKGIVWRKVVEGPANQISVSPSGDIVWRLYRNRVFAGTKITQRHPEGLKWVEAVQDVVQISVDDHCAWYVKGNGDVMMQRGLSKERPCFSSVAVETPFRVRQVVARHGVVWALTETLKLLVRMGVTADTPQGLHWKEVHRTVQPFLFSSLSVDNEGMGWAVDVLGQIWFTDAISAQNPIGSRHWWQVPLSEYYVQDPTVLDLIRSIAKKFDTQKLSHILSTNRGGLIVAGEQGVWLALDYLNTLYVCRSSLQGYYWAPAQPIKMAAANIWKQVQASIADLDWGLIWVQRANSELYTVPPDSSDAVLIPSPVFVSYGVNERSVWGLTAEGEIFIRTGMGAHCPHGVDWVQLDLSQLGELYLVHLSCNSAFVWVVDSEGQVFHRIGAAAPRPGQLNPVWLPIDTYSEIVFTKVVNSPVDWMVWAVDNRRLTYVRLGISDDLPIGKEWVHVPGIQALDITLSSSGVWALNTNGEILFRYGISQDNVSGNYWKKIPGCFTRVSASPKDLLWAVDTSGQLVKCSSRHVLRRQDSQDPLLQRTASTASEDGDWELV